MALELFQEDPYERRCAATVQSVEPDLRAFTVNQTIFYPIGGGQLGDQGWATLPSGDQIDIVDTRRAPESGEILHYCSEESALPDIRDALHLELNWERRYRLMRMHSCVHLLSALIGAQITGAQIYPDRGRVDFDLPSTLDKRQLQQSLNMLIFQRTEREVRWITDRELDANPSLVRTMAVQPPRGSGMIRMVHFKGVDLQPCGGTHVANTSEIGPVKIQRMEKKGRSNRRITIVFDDGT